MKRLLVAVVLALSAVSIAAAAPPAPVFFLAGDQLDDGVVRLDRLPDASPALRAILAAYALEIGGGCDGYEPRERTRSGERAMHCALTSALGLGGTCSARHVEAVRRAFRHGLPGLGGHAPGDYRRARSARDIAALCHVTPDTATFQEAWRSIRLTRDGELVVVDADGSWIARGDDGTFETHAVFRVRGGSVTVVSLEKSFPVLDRDGIPVTPSRTTRAP